MKLLWFGLEPCACLLHPFRQGEEVEQQERGELEGLTRNLHAFFAQWKWSITMSRFVTEASYVMRPFCKVLGDSILSGKFVDSFRESRVFIASNGDGRCFKGTPAHDDASIRHLRHSESICRLPKVCGDIFRELIGNFRSKNLGVEFHDHPSGTEQFSFGSRRRHVRPTYLLEQGMRRFSTTAASQQHSPFAFGSLVFSLRVKGGVISQAVTALSNEDCHA